MGATFSQADAQQAHYWYERRWYTAGPATLVPGQTPIFTAQNWTNNQYPQWQARLTRIAATQNANVQLMWQFQDGTANATQNLGYTDAMPANLQPMRVFAPAVELLTLTANNISVSNVTNFQLNYEIELKYLSVAEKLHYGYPLSPQDTAILALLDDPGGKTGMQQVQDLLQRGSIPVPTDYQIRRYFENQRLADDLGAGTYHTTATASGVGTPFATLHVKSGEVLVIREIALENGTSGGGVLYIDRDSDVNYEILTGAAFAQTNPDKPWDVWIPALHTVNLRAYAATSTAMTVRVRAERYTLSNILKVMLGIANAPQSVPGNTYPLILAGIN